MLARASSVVKVVRLTGSNRTTIVFKAVQIGLDVRSAIAGVEVTDVVCTILPGSDAAMSRVVAVPSSNGCNNFLVEAVSCIRADCNHVRATAILSAYGEAPDLSFLDFKLEGLVCNESRPSLFLDVSGCRRTFSFCHMCI